MDKETDQSGTEDKNRIESTGEPVKKPSLTWEVSAAFVSFALLPATWLDDFLWGFNPQLFCCMSWIVRGILLYATRYIILPVLLLILIFRLYISWQLCNCLARAIRLALLIAVALPIFWDPEPISPLDLVMLGVQAKVAATGGAANLQSWAVATIEKASHDVNDINDLDGQAVDRHLWSEQVRKLNPVGASFHISDTGIPFISITLAISWAPLGIIVGPPTLQLGDANAPYRYEFCPGVYGS